MTAKPTPTVSRRFLLGAVVSLCLAASASAEEARDFRVIVHPKNPLGTTSPDFLSDVFLKRATRWADGETIKPVDLRPNAAARRKFSERVLKRSVAAVRSYWQQRIFSGRGVPPPELDSDAAVVSYVQNNPHAIGYVSGSAELGQAKEIAVR